MATATQIVRRRFRRPSWGMRPNRLARSSWIGVWGRIAVALLVIGVLLALLAPLIAPHDPAAQTLAARLKPPGWVGDDGQSYLLGTDHLGRDVFSRLLYGGRISFAVGFGAATAAAVFGTLLGLLAGYVEGWIASVILRIVDIQIAFPFLVVAIAVVAVLGANLTTLIVTLAFAAWAPFTKMVHARVTVIKRSDFVRAAKVIGRHPAGIVLRHVVPGILGPVTVIWTFTVAHTIIAESGLSFLGLGVPPPTATWGGLVSDGRQYLETAWWIAVWPGLTIAVVVLLVNIAGQWFNARFGTERDAH